MSICRNLPNRQKTQCGLSQFCGGCRNIVPSGHVWDIKRRLSRFGHLNGHDPCNDTCYGRDLLMVQSSNQLSGPALKASTEPASHIHVPLFPAAAISNPENPGRQLSCKGSGFNGGRRWPPNARPVAFRARPVAEHMSATASGCLFHQIRQSIGSRSDVSNVRVPDSADSKSTSHQQKAAKWSGRPPLDRSIGLAGTRHSRGNPTASAHWKQVHNAEHLIGPLLGDNIPRPNDTSEQKRGR